MGSEKDTFDSCPSQIVAKKAESRNFSISFLDISSTKIKGEEKQVGNPDQMAIFLATDQKGQFGITSSVKQTEDLQNYSDDETTVDKSSSNKLRYQTLTEPELTIACCIQFRPTEILNL